MTTTGLPLPLVAAGGFTDLDTGVFWWTIVLFLLFFGILTKFGWKPILAIIEEREKSVRDSVEGAERARDEAAALLEKHHELVREAGRQREEVVKRALSDADQMKNEVIGQARVEAERLIQKAKEQIDREKKRAIQELREQVADLAVEAAGRIVKASMTPESQKQLVRDFIDKLPEARG